MLYTKEAIEFTCTVCDLRKTGCGKMEWSEDVDEFGASRASLTCNDCVAQGFTSNPETNKE